MMKNRILPTLLFHCLLPFAASISAAEPAWLACRAKAPEKQLDCYQHATEQYLAESKAVATDPVAEIPKPASEHTWKLDQLWPLPDELAATNRVANTFLQYKQNYLMLDSTYHPSDMPSSPNPLNQSTTSNSWKSSEMKFQISIKAPMPFTWPWGDSLWFGYTQQSRWQAFNSNDSRPFRENDYEPEFIYLSHRFSDQAFKLGPFTPRFLNLSYIHQSNGQTLPRSRSWNRLAAQLGSEYRFKMTDEDVDEKRIAILIRPWWRISESSADDDNPDITKFMGHGDIQIDYWRGRELVSALIRQHALQLDWSFPLSEVPNSLNLHLQYFNGYGESLIDYNHKLHSFGIGLSLPY
jgi:phospholipase A1